MDHMHHNDSANSSSNTRWNWVLLGFLAVAGFFLWTEHKAHVMGALPYVLLAACPLLHLFGHGGHGGHGGHRGHQHGPEPTQQPSDPKTGAPS